MNLFSSQDQFANIDCGTGGSWSVDEVSTLVIAVFTIIYTIGTLALWWHSYLQLKLIRKKMDREDAVQMSLSNHYTANRHRDIFMEVLEDRELLKLMAKETKISRREYRRNMLASILINHARSIFTDHTQGIREKKELEAFESDLKGMFSMPFIKKRWQDVKRFHSTEFREFVDKLIDVK